MKVNELLTSIHNTTFDMEKRLEVKKYIPMDDKRFVADCILLECTENVNGFIVVDSVQQYLSYVRYMILKHTNLEYSDSDYDTLCSTEYNGMTLLNAIMNCFEADAKECTRILKLMTDDFMQTNSTSYIVGQFLNSLIDVVNDLGEKIDGIDMSVQDTDALKTFLSKYIK